MVQKNTYTGSVKMAVLRTIVYGLILSGVFGAAAFLCLLVFPEGSAEILYGVFHWPVSVFSGMLMGAAVVFFKWTTVKITEGQITIGRLGHQETYLLGQYVNTSIIRKARIGSYTKYETVKCSLIFRVPEGTRKVRLYGFGEKDLEILLNAMRDAKVRRMTVEEKAEVKAKYRDEAVEALLNGKENRNEFLLPASDLIKKEKKCMKRILKVVFAVLAAVGMLDVWAVRTEDSFNVRLFFLTAMAVTLVVLLLAQYVGLYLRRRICAEKIVIDGEGMRVGGQYYSYLGIQKVRMTSPRKRSSSIFQTQRYLYIFADDQRKKYWLGSEASFDAYGRLCRSLEQAMVSFPDKLKYL